MKARAWKNEKLTMHLLANLMPSIPQLVPCFRGFRIFFFRSTVSSRLTFNIYCLKIV